MSILGNAKFDEGFMNRSMHIAIAVAVLLVISIGLATADNSVSALQVTGTMVLVASLACAAYFQRQKKDSYVMIALAASVVISPVLAINLCLKL